MKNLRFNTKKLLALLLAGSIALTTVGCSKKKSESVEFGTVIESVQDNTCFDEYTESIACEANNPYVSLMDSLEILEEQLKILDILPDDIKLDEGLKDEIKLPTVEYEVKGGDTLSGIASRFGVSVDSIMEINNLTGTTIYPKQILKISALTTGISSLEEASAILVKYNDFDSLTREEKVDVLNKIVEIRHNANQWIKNRSRNILERAALSTLKCKILDAYDLDESFISDVVIEGATRGDNTTDATLYGAEVDKKGQLINYDINFNDELSTLLGYLYNLQNQYSTLDFSEKEELSFDDIELVKEYLRLIATVISKDTEVKDSFWGNKSLKLVQ